jgi:phospholipid/cholesterol/gamma-HCH transport system ATP-binding protein
VAFRLLNEGDQNRTQAREYAIARLGQVGLPPETADLYPSEVSGGMQKRVGLARAIATDPDIIFLDDPTAGLDPIMSTIISELINERVDELAATVVSIVSDLAVVRNIADSVVMLHEGWVVWSGSIAELDETDNPYFRQADMVKNPLVSSRDFSSLMAGENCQWTLRLNRGYRLLRLSMPRYAGFQDRCHSFMKIY